MVHIAFPTLNNLAWVDFWTIMFPLFVSLPLQLKSIHKKRNIIPLHLNKIFTLSSVKIRLTLIVARKFFGVILSSSLLDTINPGSGSIWSYIYWWEWYYFNQSFRVSIQFPELPKIYWEIECRSSWLSSYLMMTITKIIIQYFCYIITINWYHTYNSIHMHSCVYVYTYAYITCICIYKYICKCIFFVRLLFLFEKFFDGIIFNTKSLYWH